MRIEGKKMEEEGLLEVARKMCIAARTAPKAKGRDNLLTLTLTGGEKDAVAAEMQRIGEETQAFFFVRDAANVRVATALIILGTRIDQMGLPNCGFCGFADCEANRTNGGICAFNTGDLGIAVGSAVGTASDCRVDNRIMFTAGRAALNLRLLGDEVRIAYGIPLSVAGKNPFFDRK